MDVKSFVETLEGLTTMNYTFGTENHSCVNNIMEIVNVLTVDNIIEVRGDREDSLEIHIEDIQSIQQMEECNLIAVYLVNGIISIYYGDSGF